MRHLRTIVGMAALALAGTGTPVSAATFLFNFEGSNGWSDVSFTLDDAAAPTGATKDAVRFDNIRITEGTVARLGSVNLFTNKAGGGFNLGDDSGFDAGGPQLFKGSMKDPQFLAGVSNMTWVGSKFAIGRLTISEVRIAPVVMSVPEPASWTMILFGFAAVGQTLRRKPRRVKVRYSTHAHPSPV